MEEYISKGTPVGLNFNVSAFGLSRILEGEPCLRPGTVCLPHGRLSAVFVELNSLTSSGPGVLYSPAPARFLTQGRDTP